MADLWQNIKNLFKQSEQSTKNKPFIHELIERSKAELEVYEEWKEKIVARQLLAWLHDQYTIYKVLPDDIDKAIGFLNTPSSKGFVIYFNKTSYTRQDALFLGDWLKEKVQAINLYRTQVSDTKSYSYKGEVEQLDRHYLKPKPNFKKGGPIEKDHFIQKYGNILIETILRNDMPYQLKFSATVYNDRLFKKAEDFDDLWQIIMQDLEM